MEPFEEITAAKNVIEALSRSKNFKFDLNISVPPSKRQSFERKYGLPSSGDSKSQYYYPETLGTDGVTNLINSLPSYARVSNVKVFGNGHDAEFFYSGPFDLKTANKKITFVHALVEEYSRRLQILEKKNKARTF